jgi:carboxyl-terminal processing protease
MMMTSLLAVSVALMPAPRIADDFAKTYADATRLIEARFYAKATRKDEMTKIFAKYRDPATNAKSREEFGQIMNRMIEDFQDSHFAFLGDDTQGFYTFDALMKRFTPNVKPAPMPNIGAWFKHEKDGSYTIQMVLDRDEAARVGLRKGDKMLTINGQAFTPVKGFSPYLNQMVKIGYERDGRKFEAEVKPKAEAATAMFLNASRRSSRVIESGGKKFGYFHLWTQADDTFIDALHSAVAQHQGTDGFILDLRDGFGGRPERYADPFFRPEAKLEWGIGGAVQVQEFGYQRPLVVIINEGSRSAKEVLAYVLKKSGRATLVGRNTAGAVLGTSPIVLNEWAYIEIPMVTLKVDGKTLEDVGVAPDVLVPKEMDAKGTDMDIAKAIEVLVSKTK